jgi:hypothetical protein
MTGLMHKSLILSIRKCVRFVMRCFIYVQALMRNGVAKISSIFD